MFTLVPSDFFNPAAGREMLAEVCEIREGDVIGHKDIPQYGAVLIYNQDGDSDVLPDIYEMLQVLPSCRDYNKILCSLKDGILNLAIAQGRTLLLANYYHVEDFTTAEYYIFLALKSLQLNPEVSTISWMTPIGTEEEMSLYRYFKAVEQICG